MASHRACEANFRIRCVGNEFKKIIKIYKKIGDLACPPHIGPDDSHRTPAPTPTAHQPRLPPHISHRISATAHQPRLAPTTPFDAATPGQPPHGREDRPNRIARVALVTSPCTDYAASCSPREIFIRPDPHFAIAADQLIHLLCIVAASVRVPGKGRCEFPSSTHTGKGPNSISHELELGKLEDECW